LVLRDFLYVARSLLHGIRALTDVKRHDAEGASDSGSHRITFFGGAAEPRHFHLVAEQWVYLFIFWFNIGAE
jgi:hypothetical protein